MMLVWASPTPCPVLTITAHENDKCESDKKGSPSGLPLFRSGFRSHTIVTLKGLELKLFGL
jgi:hypothetical protein